jgi:signal transduction histidine kinase
VPGWRRALVLGLVYALLATPLDTLGHSDSLAAIVWPAPAVALAWLWRVPRAEWPVSLAAIFIVMLGVGHLDALAFWVDALFALLNAFGVWMSLELATRFVSPHGELDTSERFFRFLVCLPGISVIVMSFLGSGLSYLARGQDFLVQWGIIMGSNSIAKLVLVPGILEWSRPKHPDVPEPKWWAVVIPALCAGWVMAEAFRFRVPEETEHGLLVLMLVWAAIVGSMRGATLAAFTLAATGIVLTVTGNGSYHQDGFAGIHQLQVDLGVFSMLAFFIAIALTERRVNDVRLARANQLESLGMLASGVAHDFNNVLAAVRGHAEYAEELLPERAAARRPLEHVLAAVRSGHAMTEQMLMAVGRGAARRTEPVSMRAVMEEALALAAPDHAAAVAIEARVDSSFGSGLDASAGHDPAGEPIVSGDHAQLVRVMLNLLRNAAQAARSQVVVELGAGMRRTFVPAVGTVPLGDVVWLEVRDDGPGIPPEVVSHIFEPFFSTKLGKSGHGLGLSIAAGIVADHQGGIVCGPSALGGASFRVLLPAQRAGIGIFPAPEHDTDKGLDKGLTKGLTKGLDKELAKGLDKGPAKGPAEAAGSGDLPPGQGETVLLVEDDPNLRVLIEDWLAELGFEPAGYSSSPAALAALRADPLAFALLISDIELAELRGDALIAEARVCAPALPALLISAAAEGVQIAGAAGVPFLAKPFGRADLEQALRALIPSL